MTIFGANMDISCLRKNSTKTVNTNLDEHFMAQNLINKCVFIVRKDEVCGFNDNRNMILFVMGVVDSTPCTFRGF
jgi:hypothetical protein